LVESLFQKAQRNFTQEQEIDDNKKGGKKDDKKQ
jgi:hypothetical protein